MTKFEAQFDVLKKYMIILKICLSANRIDDLQSNTFSKLSYMFLIHQNVSQISFEVYDGFIGQRILKL